MSTISFQESLKSQRQAHLEALAKVEDGDSHKHSRIKGVMQGLEEASALFAKHLKADSEET